MDRENETREGEIERGNSNESTAAPMSIVERFLDRSLSSVCGLDVVSYPCRHFSRRRAKVH